MRVQSQYEINPMNGESISKGRMETELDDPVFLNMQFYMEREKFIKLSNLCKEYKLSNIHYALSTLLTEVEPEIIIDTILD